LKSIAFFVIVRTGKEKKRLLIEFMAPQNLQSWIKSGCAEVLSSKGGVNCLVIKILSGVMVAA
jgi:hypothetical protein